MGTAIDRARAFPWESRPMPARFVAALAALVFVVFSTAEHAAAGNLPRELVSRYRPAIERLREAYAKATIEGVSELNFPRDDKWRQQEFIVRANGKLRRLDVKTVAQHGMGLDVGAIEMRMATPWGSLITRTNPGSDFFDDATELPYDKTVAEIYNGSLMNYPYSLVPGTTILDMLLSSEVDITSVKAIKSKGEQLVEITYRHEAKFAGHSGRWNCRLVLSPRDGWGLRGFVRTLGSGSSQVTESASVSYSGHQGGVPLISAIESETTEGAKVIKREMISVGEVTFEAPDNDYFDSWTF
jgi:hypothetical protein